MPRLFVRSHKKAKPKNRLNVYAVAVGDNSGELILVDLCLAFGTHMRKRLFCGTEENGENKAKRIFYLNHTHVSEYASLSRQS